jgi:tetratricopeptide (TPR) repeat protein
MKKSRKFLWAGAVLVLGCFFWTGCGSKDTGSIYDIPGTQEEVMAQGTQLLEEEDYDEAIRHYEAAYRKDKDNPEAAVYSSLANLAVISVDSRVANLMKNRFGFIDYPNKLNALLSDDWMAEYKNSSEWENTSRLPKLKVPGWFKTTQMYTKSLINGEESVDTWELLLLANLVENNTGGINPLLDEIISSVFGDSFEEVCKRIDALEYEEAIILDEGFIKAVYLEDFFDEFDIRVGKAELNIVVSALRVVKASLEWIASYNLETDLSFLKTDWDDPDGIIQNLKSLDKSKFPFNNNFLEDRKNGMMAKSKTDIITAIDRLIGSYDFIITSTFYPDVIKDTLNEYSIVKDGLTDLKEAIDKGTFFEVTDVLSGSGLLPVEFSGFAGGIDMGKLFTPGYFSLKSGKLVETNSQGKPQFYLIAGSGEVQITSAADLEAEDFYAMGIKIKPDLFTGLISTDLPIDELFSDLPTIELIEDQEIAKIIYSKYY